MPFSTQQYRVTIRHEVNGTDEIAETGFSISNPIGFDAVDFQDAGGLSFLGDVDTAWRVLIATSGVIWPSWSKYVSLKGAPLGTDGRYVREPDILNTGLLGTSGTKVLPQETVVVSLSSRQSLGSGNRGRMYLPHITGTFGAGSPRIQNASALSLAAQTFIQSVNAAAQTVTGFPIAGLCIMSAKGAGTTKRVMDIKVGDLADTQRRRRNRLGESYVARTIIV